MVRTQQKKGTTTKTDEVTEEVAPAGAEKAEKLKGDIDDLLDEIDGVLEENSEEFVRAYVQKGGE